MDAPADLKGPHGQLISEVADLIHRFAPARREVRPMEHMRTAEQTFGKGWDVTGAAWRKGTGHIIAWALNSDDPFLTGRHEAVHALRQAGLFTNEEWKALEEYSVDHWMDKHQIERRYPNHPWEAQAEEGVAEGFAHWRQYADALPPVIRGAFKHLDLLLRRIADAVKQRLGANVSAQDVLGRIESGEVGRRAQMRGETTEPLRTAADVAESGPAFQLSRRQMAPRARDRRQAEAQREINEREGRAVTHRFDEILGRAPDAITQKAAAQVAKFLPARTTEGVAHIRDLVRLAFNPMGAGSDRAQAEAKDFANSVWTTCARWEKVNDVIRKNFTPEQRRNMALALDEHGVIVRQNREPGPFEGLNRLEPDERAVVEDPEPPAGSRVQAGPGPGHARFGGTGLPLPPDAGRCEGRRHHSRQRQREVQGPAAMCRARISSPRPASCASACTRRSKRPKQRPGPSSAKAQRWCATSSPSASRPAILQPGQHPGAC